MGRAIGILGCGTIGQKLTTSIREGTVSASTLRIFDRHPDRAETFIDGTETTDVAVVRAFDQLLSDVDIVVEAAGQSALREHAVETLRAGCDLVALSIGALADQTLRERVIEAAEETGRTVSVPSGAVAGLDAITAAENGELESVSLTTTKPPEGIAGAPYLDSHGIDVHGLTEPTTVFEGSATEAATGFPSNINVAVALSLAGIGPEQTRVQIIADPDQQRNVHRIAAQGAMGDIETTVRNSPSPTNPKTSYLAVLSTIERLREDRPVQVGT